MGPNVLDGFPWSSMERFDNRFFPLLSFFQHGSDTSIEREGGRRARQEDEAKGREKRRGQPAAEGLSK